MKDKAGKTIKPGDLIVYGKALGRSAGMQYGKALYVLKAHDKWNGGTREDLRFIGVDDGWNPEYEPTLQKPSFLSFESRILVVERSQVTSKALKLLDSIDLKDYPPKNKREF